MATVNISPTWMHNWSSFWTSRTTSSQAAGSKSITVRAIRRVPGVEAAGPIYTSTTEIVSSVEPLKISLLATDPRLPACHPC